MTRALALVREGLHASACPCCGAVIEPPRALLDDHTRTLTYDGATVELQSLHFLVCEELFLAWPGSVPRERLITRIWTDEMPDDVRKNMDVAIYNTRKRIAPLGLTIRTIGGGWYGERWNRTDTRYKLER